MTRIIVNKRCHDIIRIGPKAFVNLCALLRDRSGFRPIQRVIIEE